VGLQLLPYIASKVSLAVGVQLARLPETVP